MPEVTSMPAEPKLAVPATSGAPLESLQQMSNQDLLERIQQLEERVAASPEPVQLPPTCVYRHGRLVRLIDNLDADGNHHQFIRAVALTQQEAREKRWDWYHPEFGWVREGYKLEKDRSPQNIMADASVAQYDPRIMAEITAPIPSGVS